MSLSGNSQIPQFSDVDCVEYVECALFSQDAGETTVNCETISLSTNSKEASVETVASCSLKSYFSTLSTVLQNASVENCSISVTLIPSDLDNIPRFPQIPQHKVNTSVGSEKLSLINSKVILEWLQIVVVEGHIEPSQPSIGRIVGWPKRTFSCNALFIDFTLWCRIQGIPNWKIPLMEQCVLAVRMRETNVCLC